MREASLNFLKTLVNTPSPTGHETRGQRVWLDYAGQFADETFSDAYGNCVAVLNKGGGPRLMLAAHADEIAMAPVPEASSVEAVETVKPRAEVSPAPT